MSVRIRAFAWVAMVGLGTWLSGCAAATTALPYASAHGRDCARAGSRVLSSFTAPSPAGCFVVVCSHDGACRAVGR
jgi:hypothetical protein